MKPKNPYHRLDRVQNIQPGDGYTRRKRIIPMIHMSTKKQIEARSIADGELNTGGR
jgi:hypothetical protein